MFFYHTESTFWQNLQQLELPGGSTGPWNTGSLENVGQIASFQSPFVSNFQEFIEKEYIYWVPVMSSARHEERLWGETAGQLVSLDACDK